jgi:hypothetical protein
MRAPAVLVLGAMLVLAACSDAPAVDPRRQLVAGERVGPIVLDMRWADVVAAIGPPPAEPVVLVRVGHATWPALGLEALVTSPDEARITDDAVVIGAGATVGADLEGLVLPGDARIGIETSLGAPPEEYGGRVYYPSGLAIEYDESAHARRVGVVAPYVLAPEPPPMAPASGGS